MKVTGFDELAANLERFRKNAEAIDGTNNVPIEELMPPPFVRKYTDFSDIQAMLDAAGIDDAEQIKEQPWSDFVAQHSRFDSWEDMTKKAGEIWITKKLGF